MQKNGRNDNCPCGSGKKFKKCCLGNSIESIAVKQNKDWADWGKRVSNLPVSFQIISTNESPGDVSIYKASIIKNGVKCDLISDEIKLDVNGVNGDKLAGSQAFLSCYQNGESSKIVQNGNATVNDGNMTHNIKIVQNKSCVKAKSMNGLWAKVQIKLQRNTNIKYFQLIFGEQGKEEIVDESSIKNRPHIDFYPNLNGKFIRLSKYSCDLIVSKEYELKGRCIFPKKIEIKMHDYGEALIIDFIIEDDYLVLQNAYFI